MKITGNPITVATMSKHIDIDVTGILRLEMTLDQAAPLAGTGTPSGRAQTPALRR
jgi:altronate dehydratase